MDLNQLWASTSLWLDFSEVLYDGRNLQFHETTNIQRHHLQVTLVFQAQSEVLTQSE